MGYIRFENIVKNFGNTQVLKNINLDIEKGQLVTLLLSDLPDVERVRFFVVWQDWKQLLPAKYGWMVKRLQMWSREKEISEWSFSSTACFQI